MDTLRATTPTLAMGSAASADAALIDGHIRNHRAVVEAAAGRVGRRGLDRWTRGDISPPRESTPAASADAALIDGHTNNTTVAVSDAALIDGHELSATNLTQTALPRRPTRP